MIIRVVKMTFKPDAVEDFLRLFEENKEAIRASDGCSYLELLQVSKGGNVFMTYSHWDNEENL